MSKTAPNTIYLIPDSYEGIPGYVWAEEPAPGLGQDPADAIQYKKVKSEMSDSPACSIAAWKAMDTAPKDGTEILLYAMGDIGLCYWRKDEVMTGWTWGLGHAFNNPSHWMPLPESPRN